MSGISPREMKPKVRARWMLARVKHCAYMGGKETPEHYIWRGMLRRKDHKGSGKYYANIDVCEQWQKSFAAFLEDVGFRPSKEYQLDRLDNTKGYEPGNVAWRTRSQQQKNKSTTKFYSDGVFSGTLVECAAYLRISKELAHWRFKHWDTFEKGVTWQLQNRK